MTGLPCRCQAEVRLVAQHGTVEVTQAGLSFQYYATQASRSTSVAPKLLGAEQIFHRDWKLHVYVRWQRHDMTFDRGRHEKFPRSELGSQPLTILARIDRVAPDFSNVHTEARDRVL
jgi:hypothetical protein